MALLLVNKKGTAAGAVIAILLLLSATYAAFMVSPPSPRVAPPTSQWPNLGRIGYYETYLIILEKPPNADAMDNDEEAHRRWHQSFLRSTVIIGYSGKLDQPRLLDSYYRYVRYGIYAFSARLTFAEIDDVVKKPGVLGSRRCPPLGPTLQCIGCPVADWDCGELNTHLLVSSNPAALD